MERVIEFRKAYDRKSEGYGIHSVDMCWYLKGPKGVIQFITYTNWHLPHIQEHFDKLQDREFPHLSCHPHAFDIGYHSYKPIYEGQTAVRSDCHLLNAPCYYDGSSLQAEEVLQLLISQGSEAVWQEMQNRYNEIFESKEIESGQLGRP